MDTVEIVEFPLRYVLGTTFNRDEDGELRNEAVQWMINERQKARARLSELYRNGYSSVHDPLPIKTQRHHVGSRFSTDSEIVLLVYTLAKLPDGQ